MSHSGGKLNGLLHTNAGYVGLPSVLQLQCKYTSGLCGLQTALRYSQVRNSHSLLKERHLSICYYPPFLNGTDF